MTIILLNILEFLKRSMIVKQYIQKINLKNRENRLDKFSVKNKAYLESINILECILSLK